MIRQVEVSTFVRHPDTNEMLPAEASGRMRRGDQLVDINGHNVEGMNSDEATALIRKVLRSVILSILDVFYVVLAEYRSVQFRLAHVQDTYSVF